jgi:hypothetical protein
MFHKIKIKKRLFFQSKILGLFCFIFFGGSNLVLAESGNYQRCELNNDCLLGEYVFDNDGNPVNQQACVINIKNPLGGTLVDNVSMDFESDGWHSYTLVPSSPKGLYRSLMCCTVETDSACLDKSFMLGASLDSLESGNESVRKATFDFSGSADTGSTAATLVDAELDRPDDYWKNYTLVITTGPNTGDERVVTSFDSASKALFFSAFSQTINVGDDYILRRDNSLIAGIWSYANRTLSSVANVAGDIWGYSSRTLSSFGSLASDIWSDSFAPNRILTSENLANGQKLSTEVNIEELKTELLNEIGIVETNLSVANLKIDSVLSNSADIEAKIDESKIELDNLNLKVDAIQNVIADVSFKIDELSINWDGSDISDILRVVESTQVLLGAVADDANEESLFGRTKYLTDKWGIQTAQSIFDSSAEIISKTSDIQEELGYKGKSNNAFEDLQLVKNYMNSLESTIGTSADIASSPTLFGKVKDINEKVSTLNEIETSLTDLVGKWEGYNNDELVKLLADISKQIDEINFFEIDDNLASLSKKINENLDDTKSLQNKAIEIKATLDLYRTLIENKPTIKTFYEWGSVVLKIVVANPSEINQKINFRSALPKEIQPKDVINKDEDLTFEFDAEKDLWFVSLDVEILGNQSVTKFVEVQDIWRISEEEIDSLMRESLELKKPLENTGLYAQGIVVQNDITSRLDKIRMVQNQESITPETHILNYRVNLAEMEIVKRNIESLRGLVGDVSNNDNFKGSLMGISTTMTWSIILVVIVGVGILLIFLVVALRGQRETVYKNENSNFFDKAENAQTQEKERFLNSHGKIIYFNKKIVLRVLILTILILFLLAGFAIYQK